MTEAAKRASDAAAAAGVNGHAMALRWTMYHSILSGEHGDAVILGASSLQQLEDNLDAIEAGPLTQDLVELVNGVWDSVQEEAASYHL